MKDKISMPLIEAMLQYKSEDVYPLHTPGHKGGRGMQRLLRQELGASVQMDVSLMSELDDIHEPETYIKEAQELAAQTYGSDVCFWAVNGTSQAIHAMLLTALNPGEKLLLPRHGARIECTGTDADQPDREAASRRSRGDVPRSAGPGQAGERRPLDLEAIVGRMGQGQVAGQQREVGQSQLDADGPRDDPAVLQVAGELQRQLADRLADFLVVAPPDEVVFEGRLAAARTRFAVVAQRAIVAPVRGGDHPQRMVAAEVALQADRVGPGQFADGHDAHPFEAFAGARADAVDPADR